MNIVFMIYWICVLWICASVSVRDRHVGCMSFRLVSDRVIVMVCQFSWLYKDNKLKRL